MRRFLTESDCHVAVSLHNPFPAERVLLMPVERAYPITKIVNLLAGFPAFARRRGANECESRQRRISLNIRSLKGIMTASVMPVACWICFGLWIVGLI